MAPAGALDAWAPVRRAILGAGLVLACALASAAQAGAGREVDPRLSLRLGLTLNTADTRIGAQSRRDRSWFASDFEGDLGLDDRATVPFAELEWRWSERWRLQLAYQRLHRKGRGWLTVYDDNGVGLTQVNVDVLSHFEADALRLSAGYTLSRRPEREAVLLLGAQVTQLSAGVQTPDHSDDYHGTGWAPLPDLGLLWRQRLDARWRLEARLHYFPYGFARLSGERRELYAAMERQLAPGWGLGVGYRYNALHLDDRTARRDAHLDFVMTGPVLYLNSHF